MKNIDRIKRNIATQREEDYLRTTERILWVGGILISLSTGFLIGMIVTAVKGKQIPKDDYYYTVAVQYGNSPDTLEDSNGNLWCITEMEIDHFHHYRLKLNDNGTETVVDDEIIEIIPMD